MKKTSSYWWQTIYNHENIVIAFIIIFCLILLAIAGAGAIKVYNLNANASVEQIKQAGETACGAYYLNDVRGIITNRTLRDLNDACADGVYLKQQRAIDYVRGSGK